MYSINSPSVSFVAIVIKLCYDLNRLILSCCVMLKTLKPSEIARYCDVHQRTVSRWIASGELVGHKLPGRGNYRVQVSDFINFLKKQNMPISDSLSLQKQVLIIDDEVNVRSSIKRTLKKQNFSTIEAASGFEAGLLLQQKNPDLITVDLRMPGISGLEVIRMIRAQERFSDVKILVISGVHEEELKNTIVVGAHGYLCKPFTSDELINIVNKLVNK